MTATTALIDRARKYLQAVPGAVSGQGGHNRTFVAASALVHGFALSDVDALTLLREWNSKCTPPWSERELDHKIRSAATSQHSNPRGHLAGSGVPLRPARPLSPAVQPRPKIDPATAAENWLKGFRCGEADLFEESPIRPPDDFREDGVALLEALYRPGELINFIVDHEVSEKGKPRPRGVGMTMERDDLIRIWAVDGMRASEAGGWLRMNPVDGEGIRDVNVTAFRFALLESDELPPDLQLRLLARLPLPIACILTSGARSVHAWVKVDAPDADAYRSSVIKMLGVLSPFGFDGKNKNPSRLSRLPGVVRKLGARGDGRQRLLYLNSTPTHGRIL